MFVVGGGIHRVNVQSGAGTTVDIVWKWDRVLPPVRNGINLYTAFQSAVFANSWYTFGGVPTNPEDVFKYSPLNSPLYVNKSHRFGGNENGTIISRVSS